MSLSRTVVVVLFAVAVSGCRPTKPASEELVVKLTLTDEVERPNVSIQGPFGQYSEFATKEIAGRNYSGLIAGDRNPPRDVVSALVAYLPKEGEYDVRLETSQRLRFELENGTQVRQPGGDAIAAGAITFEPGAYQFHARR